MITRREALQTGIALGALAAGRLKGAERPPDTASGALQLWYRRPAETWTEALPIGNGRLGAMIFGGVARERLQLNDDTLYAGGPYDPSDPGARDALPRVRELIAQGKYAEAQSLANEKMMGRPLRMPSYQTVGDLVLNFAASSFAEGYRRDLDLDTAVAGVEFRQGGVTYRREMFASATDQVIAVRIRADREGAVNLRASFETPMPGAVRVEDNTLLLAGTNTSQEGVPAAPRFEARVRVVAQGGELISSDDALTLRGAHSALILVATATNYRRYDDVGGDPTAITRAQLAAAAGRTWEELLSAHAGDHQRLFRRVTLDL